MDNMSKVKTMLTVAAFCLSGLFSASLLADSSTSDQTDAIKKLGARTEILEKQLGQLKSEIKHLKLVSRSANVNHIVIAAKQPSATQSPLTASTGVPSSHHIYVYSDTPTYLFGTPVMTSPYPGIPSLFDPSDTISYQTAVNEDLNLLKRINKLKDAYKQNNWPFPNHPFVDLSGQLQLTAFQQRPYAGKKTSDVDVTDAELDIMPVFNQWVSGFMALDYDNSPAAVGTRASNSRFFMDTGFITVGNLKKSPFYSSLGQLYVPFGEYLSYMIDNPVTKYLGRTKGRAIVVGYDQEGQVNGLNVTAFTFKGDSTTSPVSNKINQFGGNIDYMLTQSNWSGDVAAGYITNIADSQSLQQNGSSAPEFGGFGGATGQTLTHRVPGLDVHTLITVGNIDFMGEYVTAATSFSPDNMTFDGVGAKPSALHTEVDYTLPASIMGNKTTILSAGYDRTSDALALLLPKQSYFAVATTSFWRDTIQALEYRHDINYSANSTATGQNTAVAASGLGNTSDTLFFELTAYF
jgi:hypothetical protein